MGYSSLQLASVTHMPHGITQCYLPSGRGDIPSLTPAEAGTRFSDPGGWKAKLLCTTTTGPTHILWSELSWRKLSLTLASAHYSCPDNAIGPAAECELIGYVKLGGAVWRQLADIFTQTQEPCHS